MATRRQRRGARALAFLLTVSLTGRLAVATPEAPHPFAALVAEILRQGPEGELPPRLSVVLGVSKLERETPVRQAVIRTPQEVHVFNVCAADHHDLVILTHNNEDQSTKAYVLSTAGHLRKAVFFRGSDPAQERPSAEASSDFAAESKFWRDFSSRLPPAH